MATNYETVEQLLQMAYVTTIRENDPSVSVMPYTCNDYCIFFKCKHMLFITGIAQQPTAILAGVTGECFQFHTAQRLKYLSFLKENV